MVTLAVLGLLSLPVLLATWVIERITKEAAPADGCGCGGRCRGR